MPLIDELINILLKLDALFGHMADTLVIPIESLWVPYFDGHLNRERVYD